MLHKKWPWYALEMCRETVQTDEIKALIDTCYQSYPNGCVANVQKGDVPARYQSLTTYLETVAGILDSIWTEQGLTFILPVSTFFSRGANHVRTG